MPDLSSPIPNEVIIASIALIFGVVGVGLWVVAYYKKKQKEQM
jgi:hypothetical protein